MSQHPLLSIGILAGGPGTSSEWMEAVTFLMRRVKELRQDVESPLAVNVVFQIPGRFLQPDFQGARSGRFSRKEKRLLVQSALPDAPSGDAFSEARDRLADAVAVAEEFAYQEGLTPTAEILPLRQLLARL